jgi:hypothetical protein
MDVAGSETGAAGVTPQTVAHDPWAGNSDAAGGFSEGCREITSELRELGAAYHRLETWEGETKVYRFQCAVSAEAEGGGEGQYRTFEATGTQPADAMQRVLADVRAWRDGALY